MGDFQHKIENAFMATAYPLLVSLRGARKPSGEKIDMSKFVLTFEDNFDGKELDASKWKRHYDGVRKGGYWDSAQTFIEDNKLIIRTEYKEDGRFGAGYYSDALDTGGLFEQTYGYFECRCKLPAAKGLWSAFWLMPQNSLKKGVPYESGTEIDVFESPFFHRRKNSVITSNLHYGGYGSGHKIKIIGFFVPNNPYTEFNTYGVEWNKDEYSFYINGEKTASSRFVSQHNEHMLLSAEVDGVNGKPSAGWSGNITKNKPGALPADFVVDYVRAYQYK